MVISDDSEGLSSILLELLIFWGRGDGNWRERRV